MRLPPVALVRAVRHASPRAVAALAARRQRARRHQRRRCAPAGHLRARHRHQRSPARRSSSCCPASASRSSCSRCRTPRSSTPRSAMPIRSAAVSTAPIRGAWYAASRSRPRTPKWVSTSRSSLPRSAASTTRSPTTTTWPTSAPSFHDLRSARAGFRALLSIRIRYVESQALAEHLLEADSLGVVYPSVRHAGGTCLACFRPALVANVRRGKTYRFTWDGSPEPAITPGR